MNAPICISCLPWTGMRLDTIRHLLGAAHTAPRASWPSLSTTGQALPCSRVKQFTSGGTMIRWIDEHRNWPKFGGGMGRGRLPFGFGFRQLEIGTPSPFSSPSPFGQRCRRTREENRKEVPILIVTRRRSHFWRKGVESIWPKGTSKSGDWTLSLTLAFLYSLPGNLFLQ